MLAERIRLTDVTQASVNGLAPQSRRRGWTRASEYASCRSRMFSRDTGAVADSASMLLSQAVVDIIGAEGVMLAEVIGSTGTLSG